MSEDGLKCQDTEKTLCYQIAQDNSICYHHVDLERKEQAYFSLDDALPVVAQINLSVPDKARLSAGVQRLRHEFRERVWVARIISRLTWPVLLICGADHTESVNDLFIQLGMNTKILHFDFDP